MDNQGTQAINRATIVNDFTGRGELSVKFSPASTSYADVPATVCLTAGDGPCKFQFDMLAEQAHALAAALVERAAYIATLNAINAGAAKAAA